MSDKSEEAIKDARAFHILGCDGDRLFLAGTLRIAKELFEANSEERVIYSELSDWAIKWGKPEVIYRLAQVWEPGCRLELRVQRLPHRVEEKFGAGLRVEKLDEVSESAMKVSLAEQIEGATTNDRHPPRSCARYDWEGPGTLEKAVKAKCDKTESDSSS